MQATIEMGTSAGEMAELACCTEADMKEGVHALGERCRRFHRDSCVSSPRSVGITEPPTRTSHAPSTLRPRSRTNDGRRTSWPCSIRAENPASG